MLRPVDVSLIRAGWVAAVVPPPYDTMTPAEQAAYAASHPDSFIHVTRSPDEGHGHPTEHIRLAESTAAALRHLRDVGAYEPQPRARLYVQRITGTSGMQHALVGAVDRRDDVQMRPHEHTHPGRAQALAEHFRSVRTMSSPIMVTVRPGAVDTSVIAEAATGAPVVDGRLADGSDIAVWAAGTEPVALPDSVYIVDGHHRATAAGSAQLDRVLLALVPPEELVIRAFHRVVGELAVMPRRVVSLLGDGLDVTELDAGADPMPSGPGEIGLGMLGRWYRLRRRDDTGELDAEFVHRVVLDGALGLDGPEDGRLAYVPGLDADPPDGEVVVLLHPVELSTVLDMADNGEVMPPKTTYIVPKLRSGVFLADC